MVSTAFCCTVTCQCWNTEERAAPEASRLKAEPVPRQVPTDVKVELVDRLVGAGLRSVEVTSFVSPKWVPQLADARDVLARVRPPPPGVRFSVLTPNLKARRST